MARPAFRFAPSPNGELHLGHAYSAILNHDLARRLGGRFLVRLEDIDPGRTREAFVAGILEDLAWLDLDWERPERRQSRHLGDYRAATERLRGLGVLYPCFATRKEIEAAAAASGLPPDPDGAPLYPGLHKAMAPAEVDRRLAAGEPHAFRLDLAKALVIARRRRPEGLAWQSFEPDGQPRRVDARAERWGDAVVVRKDVPTSYHLAVVVDDALQGISHVVRGADLEAATDLHVVLQVLLDLPTPLYHHHRLIAGPDGRKLAKSLRDTSLAALRAEGITPGAIRRMVGLG